MDWELDNPMFDKDYLAKRISNRVLIGSDPKLLRGLNDETLFQLVKTAAVNEWALLSNEIIQKNETVLRSLGMTNTDETIALTFDQVGESMLLEDDEVLNRAVSILKELRENAS